VLAGRNIDVLAAADTQVVETHVTSRSSGIGLASDVFGKLTIYDQNAARQDTDSAAVAQRTALLSANTGDLTLRAGLDSQYKGTGQGHLVTQGADLLAGEAITLSANALDLQAAANTSAQHSIEKTKSFTVGARLAGVLGSLINAVGDSVKAAHDTDNDRLQGAYALKAGYDAYKVRKTLTDVENSAADKAAAGIPEPPPVAPDGTPRDNSGAVIGVQVYVGSSKSKAESRSLETTVTGTNLQAKTISLTATETDLSMAAAKLQAEDIALSAARDILLTAAANTSELASQNTGSNTGFGVTFGFGSQNGISIQLSASQMQGKANGSETRWDNTQIAASERLSVTSGGDTTLRGAQVAGDSVVFDVGGKLLIETLQDQSRYASKQSSSGFDLSLCIPPICIGAIVQSASFNASSQKIKHAYQSAVGQSGIAAGDGGFDITVKGKTELVGAAITSRAGGGLSTDKNTLTTQRLTQ
jgi:filamentous hemagglutinin